MMAEVKLKQWGNSLGLIIPREIAKIEELSRGDTIKIEIIKNKRIDGFGMLRGIPSYKEDAEEHEEFW